MKGDKNIDYKTMRDKIENMVNDNHKDFVKAVINMEKSINDENALDKLTCNKSLFYFYAILKQEVPA